MPRLPRALALVNVYVRADFIDSKALKMMSSVAFLVFGQGPSYDE
jgi:hypothetical protein